MKVLIIGSPRSGTTSLLKGIAKQGYFSNGEPYNYNIGPHKVNNKYPLEGLDEHKNVIIKTIGYQVPNEKKGTNPVDFGIEFCSHFDKVILLDRLIWNTHWDGYVNLFKTLKQKWDYNESIGLPINTPQPKRWDTHGKWVFDSLTKEDYDWAIEKGLDKELKEEKEIIAGISEGTNIPITYYENLYGEDRMEAFDIINKWGLDDIDPFELLDYLDPSKKYRKESKDLI
jgi:hypothetical protein|tara:strand:- start:182 stop:865 length:684 start_codon:yes stop_codon:yes gene_type:complete